MSKVKSSIKEKMAEFEQLLAWFDGDSFELEEAIGKFQQAEALAKEIEQELRETKHTITVLKQRFDQAVE